MQLNGSLRSAYLNAPMFNLPEYRELRYFVNDDGELIAIVLDPKDHEKVVAIVNLGDAMQTAADAAERAVQHEMRGIGFAGKVKRIRKAMGFSY